MVYIYGIGDVDEEQSDKFHESFESLFNELISELNFREISFHVIHGLSELDSSDPIIFVPEKKILIQVSPYLDGGPFVLYLERKLGGKFTWSYGSGLTSARVCGDLSSNPQFKTVQEIFLSH